MLDCLLPVLAAVGAFRPQSQRYRPGGPRAPTASRRAQTPAAAADVDAPRPLLLDQPRASVAAMVRRAAHRETGNRRRNSGTRWSAFLANHREAVVACDFFTVPTATFQLLSCFFVIEHARRRSSTST